MVISVQHNLHNCCQLWLNALRFEFIFLFCTLKKMFAVFPFSIPPVVQTWIVLNFTFKPHIRGYGWGLCVGFSFLEKRRKKSWLPLEFFLCSYILKKYIIDGLPSLIQWQNKLEKITKFSSLGAIFLNLFFFFSLVPFQLRVVKNIHEFSFFYK